MRSIQMDFFIANGFVHAICVCTRRTITGTVSDATGPVPGVNVTAKVGVQTGLMVNILLKLNWRCFSLFFCRND
jgi:uncharacterized membrane protein YqaE (UPF0057 family)